MIANCNISIEVEAEYCGGTINKFERLSYEHGWLDFEQNWLRGFSIKTTRVLVPALDSWGWPNYNKMTWIKIGWKDAVGVRP